jgi:hypothetical protein
MSTSQPPPSTKKVRKFEVIPVETTSRSNRNANGTSPNRSDEDMTDRKDFAPKEKRRFAPVPIETSHKSNRPVNAELPTPEATPVAASISLTSQPEEKPEETPKPRRARFTPQLIESSRRSKKAGDTTPATLPTDKVRIPLTLDIALSL